MAICWVRAGVCGQETTIQVEKISQTKVNISLVTTCEHLQGLAAELQEIDFGSEIVRPINESLIYTSASRYVCRNSCIVPTAILKAMEVAGGVFLPGSSTIEFVEAAV
jgi:hypothetical protein